MPEVKPFAAIRFDPAPGDGDISAHLAPPYDVLDQRDKDALLTRSDRNIVAIDLPHVPPKSAGPPEAYAKSAALLDRWLADGTLIREAEPALYLYHQIFMHEGKSYTRRKFIARIRLTPFSEGSILPHEKTFGGPKEDRLALMKATKCQLSAILGMYTDPEDRIDRAFAEVADREPDATGRVGDVENRMWVVTDGGVIDAVVAEMADRKVYIADGHHRYGTALLYRDWLTEQAGESLPDDHPANYIMFVLASMDDPGCLILPYHRALANVTVESLSEAWSEGTEPCEEVDADVRLVNGNTDQVTPLRFSKRSILSSLEPDQCEAWHKLDYAYLHRYLIDDLFERKLGRAPEVRYAKSAEAAKAVAKEESGVALLLNATPMAHLRAVSEAGGLMPQKSTYFHPKLATGLTINPLE
ncbi:MAG: DUF1015 domain-containing protein [Planctomycetes bacterium]|nr:DUF1015 domain-containing protein [Planctomycetota bacterium]